jgi:hypothetical protein
MEPTPEIIRRQIVQVSLLALLLAFTPTFVSYLIPSVSSFMPPLMLSLLVVFSIVEAIIVWRQNWLASLLFPGYVYPAAFALTKQGKRKAALTASIGLCLSLVLIIIWVRSLL